MKLYKMVEVRKSEAEDKMNELASFVSVTYWNYLTVRLLITFVKEV